MRQNVEWLIGLSDFRHGHANDHDVVEQVVNGKFKMQANTGFTLYQLFTCTMIGRVWADQADRILLFAWPLLLALINSR